MDPWDRSKSMIHSDEYEPLMHTLNFLGFRKLLYHWSAVFVMLNFLCNSLCRRLCLTVPKAADRSIMSILSTAVICLFSMAHRMWLTNFRRLVFTAVEFSVS